ncbi:LysM peptidoglycan-binding domain-containing protein [Leptothrix sp. BB-4]
MFLRHATVSRLRFASPGPLAAALTGLALLAGTATGQAAEPNYPVTNAQRGTAQKVAQGGVPLSELAPNAPDSYTVKRGDTLWDISSLFLRSPWRWPELWGMNLDAIRNPHLIYPGQMLVLVKSGGRAQLQVGRLLDGSGGTDKLSPRARETAMDRGPIGAINLTLIQPFLTDAVVLDTNELADAPRIVAGREGRVLLGRGDVAYVRGEMAPRRDWQIFRRAQPLTDPQTGEVLGFEAAYVGTAEYLQPGEQRTQADGSPEIVPATVSLKTLRQEAGVGDRLTAPQPRDDGRHVPHAPSSPLDASVVSVYGEGLQAGQNQIIAINRGRSGGVEPGHVLSIWRAGSTVRDREDEQRTAVRLPDERNGHIYVFRVFERVSYGLILASETPVRRGDRISQP